MRVRASDEINQAIRPLGGGLVYRRQDDSAPLIAQFAKAPAIIGRQVAPGVLLGYFAVVPFSLGIGVYLAPGVGIDVGTLTWGRLPSAL